MINMEIGIESLLDVALGGPEIGPLNMSVLHGLLREVLKKLNLSNETLLISEKDPDFSESFNFIKSKFDANNNRPRTPRGSFKLGKSKVSVIVTDYFRNPLGNTSLSESIDNTTSLASADVEDRIRYLESQLKGLKAFPSVNELREWAREKKNPDTVVTDLWHFVSLNHRMDGVEEGMGKLSELVDKLIPELKMNFEDLRKIKGQIDDLFSQCSTLSDHVSRIDERIDNGVVKAEEKLQEIYNHENDLHKKLNDYAKISDLESYTPTCVFNEAQDKALTLIGEIRDDISSKVSNELNNKVDKGEVDMLSNWVKILRAQMETVPSKDDLLHMDLYVKWPQLEDALTTRYSSRPCSRQGCGINLNRVTGYEKNSESGSEPCPEILTSCHMKKFPTASCLQRLQDLGSVVERQASLMDTLQLTRVELQDKASKSDLEKYVIQEDLQHLLSMLTNLRQEVNSIQNWRESVDEEKIPALRELMVVLEKQASDLLSTLEHLNSDRNQKDKQIDNLFTFVERLEQSKLDKDDSCLEQFARKTSIQPAVEGFMAERLPQLNSQSGIFKQNVPSYGDKKYMYSHDKDVELLNKSLSISSVSPDDFINKKVAEPNEEFFFNNNYNDKYYKENEENYKNKEDVLSDLDDDFDELGLYKESDDTDVKPESYMVEKKLFETTISKLEDILKKIAIQFKNHKNTCEKNLTAVFDNLDNKLDRWELQPLQNYLEERCNSLSQQQEEFQKEIPNSSKLQKKNSWLEGTQNNSSNIYKRTGKSFKDKVPSKNNSSSIVCTHPHYGNGFVPQEKEAAVVRKQMNFNCLSCDRPLILQTNNHLQTIRGRPFNPYELDQLKLLQKVLSGDNSKRNRSCGGEYTTNTPMQKINVRINTGMSLPSVAKESNQSFVDNEIDIEGVDGRLYRGLLSRRDLSKQYPLSKSETADLRTVSPRISSG